MKFLIIIPAHNEAECIQYCLKSLEKQTFKEFSLVIVNDGSTDQTPQIVEEFTKRNENFKLVNLSKSEHQPGAKVVQTFNKGLEVSDLASFDVVCKFDADIIFPENYLAEINKIYTENPKAGMVSGFVYISDNQLSKFDEAFLLDFNQEGWRFENLSSKNHIRGPIKSYKRECLEAMGGLRPVLGWDNIDVMLSQMYGFENVTIKNLWVKHLRPTAFKYKNQKAKKLGEYFYNIGLDTPLALISSAKSAIKNRSFSEFFTMMIYFFKQNENRLLSNEEIKYIRKLRWRQMFDKMKF